MSFLNTDIVTEIPNLFSNYFIDLRDVKTQTQTGGDKLKIVELFEDLLRGRSGSQRELKQNIHPTTFTQYQKGI